MCLVYQIRKNWISLGLVTILWLVCARLSDWWTDVTYYHNAPWCDLIYPDILTIILLTTSHWYGQHYTQLQWWDSSHNFMFYAMPHGMNIVISCSSFNIYPKSIINTYTATNNTLKVDKIVLLCRKKHVII
jgi:hypothetical protein